MLTNWQGVASAKNTIHHICQIKNVGHTAVAIDIAFLGTWPGVAATAKNKIDQKSQVQNIAVFAVTVDVPPDSFTAGRHIALTGDSLGDDFQNSSVSVGADVQFTIIIFTK